MASGTSYLEEREQNLSLRLKSFTFITMKHSSGQSSTIPIARSIPSSRIALGQEARDSFYPPSSNLGQQSKDQDYTAGKHGSKVSTGLCFRAQCQVFHVETNDPNKTKAPDAG